MNLLTMEHLTKSYTDRILLDDVGFSINENEKIGVIGVNGMGKSTLLKIAAGIEDYDDGKISRGSQVKICYLPQTPVFEEADTILQAAVKDNQDELNQWTIEADAKAMLNQLGFTDFDGKASLLSGGQKKRVALVNALLTPADILVLDEPTNHLDLRATEWLEEYLGKFKGTVLTVSHDRYFLDQVVDRIIEIQEGRAEFYQGSYSFYAVEKERRYEEKLKQYEKEQAKIEQLEKAAEQMRVWAYSGMDKTFKRVKSMEKRIERMRVTDRPKKERKMEVRFGEREFRGDEVLTIKGLTKGFGGRTLFSGLGLEVAGGERIALLGDNGTGKSTFLKVLSGVTEPITKAEAILPYLEELDLVLVMTVEPGFGGQAFMESQLDTIRQVRAIIDRYNPACELEVDGGVAPKTAPLVVEAGANVLVAGSAVYGKEDIPAAIAALRV